MHIQILIKMNYTNVQSRLILRVYYTTWQYFYQWRIPWITSIFKISYSWITSVSLLRLVQQGRFSHVVRESRPRWNKGPRNRSSKLLNSTGGMPYILLVVQTKAVYCISLVKFRPNNASHLFIIAHPRAFRFILGTFKKEASAKRGAIVYFVSQLIVA